MRKLRSALALALALVCVPAFAQVNQGTSPLSIAKGGTAAFVPANYGAKCDGSTDDTAAFKSMSAAIAAAGGNALIVFPAGATCLTFNSGQTFTSGLGTLFDFSAGVSNVYVQGNGATIKNNHTFTGTDTLYNFYCKCTKFVLDSLNFIQTNGVTLPASSPIGTVGIWTFNGSADITVTNSTITGGEVVGLFSSTQRVKYENISAINSIYGIATNGCIGCGTPGGVQHLSVRNLSVNSAHDRAVFLKGVTNADISVTSQNADANDVLISSETTGQITENINLNYRVLARTSGSAPSYVTIGMGAACNLGCANSSIFRNIRINLDMDLSGDTTLAPAVQFLKSTTGAMGLTFENITIGGKISGVPNQSVNLFDLFKAADAPWSGETASNISIENLLVTGSATPAFFVDYAPFPTLTGGGFSLRNVLFPGNYTDANNSNAISQRSAVGVVSFGNASQVLAPTFGGTGLFQPSAHNLMIGEGSAAFALAAPIAGGVLGSASASADPAFTSTPNLASAGSYSINSDTWLSRAAAANWRLGQADAAAPVAQTLSAQSVVAGTSNTAGQNWTFNGSAGTGTGAGGNIFFQVAQAGSTGTAQNSQVTALSILSNGGSISNGRVGVGTGAPAATFHSVVQTGGTAMLLEGLTGTPTLEILSHTGGGNFGSTIQMQDGATLSFALKSIASGGARVNILGSDTSYFQPSGGYSIGVNTDPGAGFLLASKAVQSAVLTVATLPTCNAGSEGARAYVSDQNTAVAYRGAVTGGGTTRQAVLCSNSAWIQD